MVGVKNIVQTPKIARMDNLYLFNDVESIGKRCSYIGSRNGPAKLEDLKFTLVHPFYNEKARFNKQFEVWKSWSQYVRDRVNILIVDDGSPNPVKDYITEEMRVALWDFDFQIYRIQQDLKWNTPGALNLGLCVAPTDWVLIMDSDCAFDNENMEILLKADPESSSVYHFPRQRIGKRGDNLMNKRYLPCTKLFHRNIFETKLGGFDEDYTGEYSGGYAYFDTDIDDRMFLAKIPFFIWNGVTAIEWMPSVSGNEIVSRTQKEEKINRKLFYQKQNIRNKTLDPYNPSKILRFKFEKVW